MLVLLINEDLVAGVSQCDVVYAVKSGDCLSSILHRMGTASRELYGLENWLRKNERNNLKIKNWARLPVGTRLELVLPGYMCEAKASKSKNLVTQELAGGVSVTPLVTKRNEPIGSIEDPRDKPSEPIVTSQNPLEFQAAISSKAVRYLTRIFPSIVSSVQGFLSFESLSPLKAQSATKGLLLPRNSFSLGIEPVWSYATYWFGTTLLYGYQSSEVDIPRRVPTGGTEYFPSRSQSAAWALGVFGKSHLANHPVQVGTGTAAAMLSNGQYLRSYYIESKLGLVDSQASFQTLSLIFQLERQAFDISTQAQGLRIQAKGAFSQTWIGLEFRK